MRLDRISRALDVIRTAGRRPVSDWTPTGPGNPDTRRSTRAAVILASAGRPQLLADVIDDLSRQTSQDFDLVLSVPDQESLPEGDLPDGAVVVHDRGLAAQRN